MGKINIINLFRSQTDNLKEEFNTFKKLFTDKKILDIILIFLFSAYLILSNVLSKKPFNYIYNTIFVIFVVLLFFKMIKTKTFILNNFVLFWSSFILISAIINLSLGLMTITPYINCLNAIVFYVYLLTLEIDMQKVALRCVFISVLCYALAVIILCTKDLLIHHSFVPFYDYRLLGNLDGLSNMLALGFVLCLYYFRKKETFSIVIAIILLIYIALTSRRTAFLLVLSGMVFLVFSFFEKKSFLFKFMVLVVFAASFVAFMFLPFMKEMRERLWSSLNIFFSSSSTDGSSEARLGMIIRGIFYGVTNLFRPYGFEQISLYVFEPSHDTFGDLAYAYGGLVAIVYTIGLCVGAYNVYNKKCTFSLFKKTMAFSFVFLIILNAVFATRIFCIFIGIISGLGVTYNSENKQTPSLKSQTSANSIRYYEVKI